MLPKVIHLCWFGESKFPVEIKMCLNSWKRVLPDYEVKLWAMKDARAIPIPFLQQALDARAWAFAADVVRFYAVWKEGGVYMDSDIFLRKRFDNFIPEKGEFVTFNEKIHADETDFGLQAAFFMAAPGNEFCRSVLDYYRSSQFINPNGTANKYISPKVMRDKALLLGYRQADEKQVLEGLTVYPTRYLRPANTYRDDADAFGEHRIYGSWRKRKLGRRIELRLKHWMTAVCYYLRLTH